MNWGVRSTHAFPRSSDLQRFLAYVALLVRDYDEALAYFTRYLDFRVLEDTRLSATKRWVLVAPPGAREAALRLAQAVTAEELAVVGRQGGGRVWLFLATDDCRRDYALFRARGVTFTEHPRDEPYGTVAVFEDLYGNRWDLLESHASHGLSAPASVAVRVAAVRRGVAGDERVVQGVGTLAEVSAESLIGCALRRSQLNVGAIPQSGINRIAEAFMPHLELPAPAPPNAVLRDETVELRLLRVLGPADARVRSPEARFLAVAPECRFAIHRRSDGGRVGRIHLRLTQDVAIVRAVGHSGYEVDGAYRRQGYATRALVAIRRVARHYGIAPLWVLIAPTNLPSRRTAERAGLRLVDTVAATAEALALGLEPELCRYVAERP